jgi:hypothetical protein
VAGGHADSAHDQYWLTTKTVDIHHRGNGSLESLAQPPWNQFGRLTMNMAMPTTPVASNEVVLELWPSPLKIVGA